MARLCRRWERGSMLTSVPSPVLGLQDNSGQPKMRIAAQFKDAKVLRGRRDSANEVEDRKR